MKLGDLTLNQTLWLAPMAGVTDFAYRKLCKQFGCDVSVTEMVSAKALYFKDKKSYKLMRTDSSISPIGLQIFGSDPKVMQAVTQDILNDLNFDFIDINMGCPAPKIVKNGDGSALMKKVELAKRIVHAVKSVSNKPVTVKMRKGWDNEHVNAVPFAMAMASEGADAIAVHGRTTEQMYAGCADWEIIAKIKSAVNIPIIGNGDISTPEDVVSMLEQTQCDAVMIGRGAQGRPWLFEQAKAYMSTGHYKKAPSITQRIAIIEAHIAEMLNDKPDFITVLEMRKHISWYLKGIEGAAKIKTAINRATCIDEMMTILKQGL